jgi:hypothetical protein
MTRRQRGTAFLILLGSWGGLQAGNVPPDAAGVVVLTQRERPLEQVEKVYAQMPPVRYTPPAGRWKSFHRPPLPTTSSHCPPFRC